MAITEAEEKDFEETCKRHSDALADILLRNIPDGACDKKYLSEIIKGARITHVRELTSSLDAMMVYFKETYGHLRKPTDSHVSPEDEFKYAEIEKMRKAITEYHKQNPMPSL